MKRLSRRDHGLQRTNSEGKVRKLRRSNNFGLNYLYGDESTAIDYREAPRWLSAAAARGGSRAIANLAHMYLFGLGTAKDIGKSIQLYEAVGSKDFHAAIELGRIYSRGEEITANHHLAFKWYSSALGFETDSFNYEMLGAELSEAKTYVAQLNKTQRPT